MSEFSKSSDDIKEALIKVVVTKEEAPDNRLFLAAKLYGLRWFAHEGLDLDDPENVLQLVYFLETCPPIIIGKVLAELPDLQPYFKRSVVIPSAFQPQVDPQTQN